MTGYTEVLGDLIKLSNDGKFDVVVHGCNCFCTMGAGIAVQFAETFKANSFPMEGKNYIGDINKLGTIDYETLYFSNWDKKFEKYPDEGDKILHTLEVVNAYTQYRYGKNTLDYLALRMCLKKINHIFKGKHIGMPRIGSGLAGGIWYSISQIIQEELTDCMVTVVEYQK